MELLEGLGLEQHVDKPTHRDRHTLDLTITRMSECLVRPAPAFREKFQLQEIKSINMKQLKRDLQSTELWAAVKPTTTDELQAYVNSYNSILSALLDKHAPLRTRTRVSRPVVHWYSNEINDAKR